LVELLKLTVDLNFFFHKQPHLYFYLLKKLHSFFKFCFDFQLILQSDVQKILFLFALDFEFIVLLRKI
jgi:hypothetical protein